MARHFRDRLALTYALWSVMLVATSGALAWKFGWIPIELKPEPEASVAKSEGPSNAEAVAAGAVDEAAVEETFPEHDDHRHGPASRRIPDWGENDQSEPTGEFPPAARTGNRTGRAAADDNPFESADASRPMAPARVPAGSPEEAPAEIRAVPGIARRRPGEIDYSNVPTEAPPGQESEHMTIIRPERARGAPRDAQASRAIAKPKSGARMLDQAAEPGFPAPRSRTAGRFSRDDGPVASPDRGIVQMGAEGTGIPARLNSSDPRLQEISKLLEQGERLEAHKEMSRLYWKHPELVPELQGTIEDTANEIYFSARHFMEPYVVEPGDQLSKVAKKYSVPWEYLAKLNQVDPKRIRAGQRLKVIKGPFAAIIDLSDFELVVHCHGYYVKRYRVGVGKSNSTPTGKFTVKTKLVNPKYFGPNGNVIEADDPSNPLGERWIDLGDSYGIHGTIDPSSIGKAESKGCIRLKNADVEELYDLLIEGSEVIIRQ